MLLLGRLNYMNNEKHNLEVVDDDGIKGDDFDLDKLAKYFPSGSRKIDLIRKEISVVFGEDIDEDSPVVSLKQVKVIKSETVDKNIDCNTVYHSDSSGFCRSEYTPVYTSQNYYRRKKSPKSPSECCSYFPFLSFSCESMIASFF